MARLIRLLLPCLHWHSCCWLAPPWWWIIKPHCHGVDFYLKREVAPNIHVELDVFQVILSLTWVMCRTQWHGETRWVGFCTWKLKPRHLIGSEALPLIISLAMNRQKQKFFLLIQNSIQFFLFFFLCVSCPWPIVCLLSEGVCKRSRPSYEEKRLRFKDL